MNAVDRFAAFYADIAKPKKMELFIEGNEQVSRNKKLMGFSKNSMVMQAAIRWLKCR